MKIFPRSLTPTKMRSFFGLVDYYKRFLDGFASIASALTTLTQKSKKLERLEASERSFEIFKDRFTSVAVLTLP